MLLASATIPIIFARGIPPRQQGKPSLRERYLLLWLKTLVRLMGIKYRLRGQPMQGPGVMVSNHISWLDVPILGSVQGMSFIAKREVRGWPVIGWLASKIDTVFIRRESKRTAYNSIPALEAKINRGMCVAFFPEGTTTAGRNLYHFYPMFYQAAVRTQTQVQPVLISYQDSDGYYCSAPAYIDDEPFGLSFFRVLERKEIIATLTFLPPMDSRVLDRKQLAQASRDNILSKLQETLVLHPEVEEELEWVSS